MDHDKEGRLNSNGSSNIVGLSERSFPIPTLSNVQNYIHSINDQRSERTNQPYNPFPAMLPSAPFSQLVPANPPHYGVMNQLGLLNQNYSQNRHRDSMSDSFLDDRETALLSTVPTTHSSMQDVMNASGQNRAYRNPFISDVIQENIGTTLSPAEYEHLMTLRRMRGAFEDRSRVTGLGTSSYSGNSSLLENHMGSLTGRVVPHHSLNSSNESHRQLIYHDQSLISNKLKSLRSIERETHLQLLYAQERRQQAALLERKLQAGQLYPPILRRPNFAAEIEEPMQQLRRQQMENLQDTCQSQLGGLLGSDLRTPSNLNRVCGKTNNAGISPEVVSSKDFSVDDKESGPSLLHNKAEWMRNASVGKVKRSCPSIEERGEGFREKKIKNSEFHCGTEKMIHTMRNPTEFVKKKLGETKGFKSNSASKTSENVMKKGRDPMLRRGAWHKAEETFVNACVAAYDSGCLILPEKESLRAFVAKKLYRTGMSVTKKFGGFCQNRMDPMTVSTIQKRSLVPESQREATLAKLRVLELTFLKSIGYSTPPEETNKS